MIDLAAAVDGIVRTLTDAGVRATADLRDLNPPAVYVPPPVISYRFGKGAELEWTIAAVVPNTGRRQSISALSTLLADVQAALPAVRGGRPIDLTGIDQTGPAPAYELLLTTRASHVERITP